MKKFKFENNRLICHKMYETLVIEPWGKNAFRVRATLNKEFKNHNFALLDQPTIETQCEIFEEKATITNGKLQAQVDRGEITFYKDGKLILSELWWDRARGYADLKPGRDYLAGSGDLYQIDVMFKADRDEKIYGLGQQPNGMFNQKGCVIELGQKNSIITIPFLMSNKGYGFLWNNPAYGSVELAMNKTVWKAQATQQVDYWITADDTPDFIMQNYTQCTGRAPQFPEFASGFWQCKLRYETQDELLNVAREYKKRGLPLSVIVIDYFNWKFQGDWSFDEKCWPDPQAMVDELKSMGIELMVSVWPSVEQQSENYEELKENGFLSRTSRGFETQSKLLNNISFYDSTNPEARKYIWQKVKQNYYDYGIKVFWLDACEPEIIPWHFDNIRYYEGSGLEIGNMYPFYHEQGFDEGLRGEGCEDVIFLCRSAWAGSQRFGTAVWSGDIASSFESFNNQIRVGLNMVLSGIPWWTTDIGGFHDGDIRDPHFKELLVRWFQYGVFCPICRLHGNRLPKENEIANTTGADNEVWSFGEEVYDILEKYLALRENLRPYIMEHMNITHETGTPIMRPLFYDYHEDEKTYDIETEYMFGDAFLVAPVMADELREVEVYLPEGQWVDVFDGNLYDGAQTVTVSADIAKIPVFVKADLADTYLPLFDIVK